MEHPEPPTLALALQQMRAARGMTQDDLAERSGVSIRTISDIERGVSRYPHRDTLSLLNAALKLTDDEAALLRPTHYAQAVSASPPGTPAATAPLIGRADELQTARAALCASAERLITLTGPGGIGKTRLALELLATVPPDLAASVTFIDLAPVVNAASAPSALAHALSIRERAGQSLTETLNAELTDRRLFLVLDNFEHVLEARDMLSVLLEHCPHLRLLVTSRHPLDISGEHVIALAPLATSDLRHPKPPDTILNAPAPALFIERARAANPEFAVTPVTVRTIARICARLGGIPLAIELAAAWSDRLSPREILLQLTQINNRRFLSLLTRRTEAGNARHHSMRDAVTWSYRLLDGREQVMFRRLGIFAGSWSADAVTAICGPSYQADPLSASEWEQPDQDDSLTTLAQLAQLVNHSLILPAPSSDGSLRFSMHAVIASYAQIVLDERKEQAMLARRHAEYFTDLVERLEQELTGAQQRQSLMRLVDEYENIRAALRWARERHELDIGLRLAGALWWFWETRGYATEGREWVEGMLTLAEHTGFAARDESMARALYCAAILAAGRHDYAHAEQFGRAMLAKTNQPAKRARTLLTLGNIAKSRGDLAQADMLYQGGLAILRELNDTHGMLVALNNLSALTIERGELAHALVLIEESLTLKRQVGDRRSVAVSLMNLGEIQKLQGEWAAARRTLEEGLQIFQELEDHQGTALALSNLGELADVQGDDALAIDHFAASLILYRQIEDATGEAQTLRHLGKAYARRSDTTQAEMSLRASASRFEAQGQLSEALASLVTLASLMWTSGEQRLATQALNDIRQRLNRTTGTPVTLSPDAQAEYERLQAQVHIRTAHGAKQQEDA